MENVKIEVSFTSSRLNVTRLPPLLPDVVDSTTRGHFNLIVNMSFF